MKSCSGTPRGSVRTRAAPASPSAPDQAPGVRPPPSVRPLPSVGHGPAPGLRQALASCYAKGGRLSAASIPASRTTQQALRLAVAWGDADGDGFLELAVANYAERNQLASWQHCAQAAYSSAIGCFTCPLSSLRASFADVCVECPPNQQATRPPNKQTTKPPDH